MRKKGTSQKTIENGEVELLKNQLARSLADYDNLVKRVDREREELRNILTGRIVVKFLTVLDMLYEAQKHLNDSGIALTIKEFEDTLKLEGIEKIEPKEGEEFTEELHEVIEVVNKEGLENNMVAECVLTGWKFVNGNVIRHAKVKVNKNE